MLIDKGVSEGEVITLKLTSGEELIARLVEDNPTYYKVGKPMVIGMGQNGPGLMPYLFTVHPDKDVKISKATVVVAEPTEKGYSDSYIQGTTGIKLV